MSQYQSDDRLLRSHGFVIHARPRSGEVLWKRVGRLYTQGQAVQAVVRHLEFQRKLRGGLD